MDKEKHQKIFGDSQVDPKIKKEKPRRKPPTNMNKAPSAPRDKFDKNAYAEGLQRVADRSEAKHSEDK